MSNQNRVIGGRKGKNDGHVNEERITEELRTNLAFRSSLLQRLGKKDVAVSSISVGGLHEKGVPGVVRKTTKLKTDMKIHMEGQDESINISIKKGLEDQAYLVKCSIFIALFESRYGVIEADVKHAMKLFWYGETETALKVIEDIAQENIDLQRRHKSLNADTLKLYNQGLYDKLLQWFKDNVDKIAELVFSKGDVKEQADWAHFLWYKNMLGDHEIDHVFSIEEICSACKNNVDMIAYGDKNGGTTIQLPFGKVQWHQRSMQFRHDYLKVKSIMERN